MPTPFDSQLERLCQRCDDLIDQPESNYNDGLRRQLNAEARTFMAVARRTLNQCPSYTVDDVWIQHALRVIGRMRYFIQQYQYRQGVQQRDHFAQLYDLKHDLLTALCLVTGPVGFSWAAGLSTDTPNCISLLFLHQDQPLYRMHLHWPRWHVSDPVIVVMRTRYGHWPLVEPLAG